MIKKLKTKAKELKKQTIALYLASKHKDTPLLAKIFTVIIVAYALSPIDLIPDFIPVLGFIDDIILLPLGIYLAIKLIPHHVLEQCKKDAENIGEGPKSYIAATIIILIWIGIISLIILKIFDIL